MKALSKFFCIVPFFLLGMVASFLPLIRDFYLETAQITSILFSFYIVWSYSASTDKKLSTDVSGVAHFRHLGIIYIKMGIFLLPILISSIISECFTATGVMFVLFIPVVGVLFVYTILLITQHYFRHFRFWATVIILVISVLVPFITLKFAPHVFLFNPVWGWFPGPIYDEQVIFPIQLVYHGLFVITLSSLLVIVNRNIFKARFLYKMMCFLVITVILFAYLFNWSNIGFGYSLQTIKMNLGGVVESEHFVFVYDENALSKDDVNYWLFWHEFHYGDLTEKLKIESGHEKIVSVLYRDVWQKLKYTGAKYTSYVPVWNVTPQLHLDQQTADQLLRHELVHVLLRDNANPIIGANVKIGITEGVAVALEDPRSTTYTRDEILINSQVDINSELIDNAFSFLGFYGGRSAINYSVSGSFVQYLLQQYSVDHFKCIYGGESFDACYDSFPQIKENWAKYINESLPDSSISGYARNFVGRESIFEKKCARFVSKEEMMYDRSQMHYYRREYDKSYQLLKVLYEQNPQSSTIWLGTSQLGVYFNEQIPKFEFSTSNSIVDSINIFLRSADLAYLHDDYDEVHHFISGLKRFGIDYQVYNTFIMNQLALRGIQHDDLDYNSIDNWDGFVDIRYRNIDLKDDFSMEHKNLWLTIKSNRLSNLNPGEVEYFLSSELGQLSVNNLHFLISNVMTFNRTNEQDLFLTKLLDKVREHAESTQERKVLELYMDVFQFSETYH